MRCSAAVVVMMIIFLVPFLVSSRHISRQHSHHGHGHGGRSTTKTRDGSAAMAMRRGADTVQVAGSRLPDCTHACGSCKPCRLVMVSFVCASLEEAETCPMAYKCMCNNKSYPVP